MLGNGSKTGLMNLPYLSQYKLCISLSYVKGVLFLYVVWKKSNGFAICQHCCRTGEGHVSESFAYSMHCTRMGLSPSLKSDGYNHSFNMLMIRKWRTPSNTVKSLKWIHLYGIHSFLTGVCEDCPTPWKRTACTELKNYVELSFSVVFQFFLK